MTDLSQNPRKHYVFKAENACGYLEYGAQIMKKKNKVYATRDPAESVPISVKLRINQLYL